MQLNLETDKSYQTPAHTYLKQIEVLNKLREILKIEKLMIEMIRPL